jgi:hypothetical protein
MLLFKRIIQKVKQWFNRSDAPKYLSGKDKGNLDDAV